MFSCTKYGQAGRSQAQVDAEDSESNRTPGRGKMERDRPCYTPDQASYHQVSNQKSLQANVVLLRSNFLIDPKFVQLTCKYSFVCKYVLLFHLILAFYFQAFFKSIVIDRGLMQNNRINWSKCNKLLIQYFICNLFFQLLMLIFPFKLHNKQLGF